MISRTRLLRTVLGARLPTTEGSISLRGVHETTTIRRDHYGIVYIDAGNEDDAWFGLGFCQAQDRAFQLEVRLRTLRGTLSALFGPQTLPIDRLARRIGFVESARRQMPVMDADVTAEIEAFVRGVNAGLLAGASRPAPEFALLRARPSMWKPEDVIAMGKLLSFMLIGNWDDELSRLKILLADGPQALRDLDPTPYPEDHVVVSPPGAAAGPASDALSVDLDRFLAFAGRSGGSNAWVVAGSRTKSGLPILANDPHLEATLPPHWYLACLRTPQWRAAGASMIGSPGFGAGHNGFAAWGVTAGLADTSDLFIEELGPDGRSVRNGSGFEACQVRREDITVRGTAPVTEEVLVTPRGPIISPALDGGFPALSLRAVWLDAKPARGFLRLHAVRSFEQLREQFKRWPMLSQNVVYADAGGTTAWQLVGEVPVRKRGFGMMPITAGDAGSGWRARGVPFSQMPSLMDPPEGFVATANNKPVADDAALPYLGSDWLDGYRAGRIGEALAGRDDWDAEAMLRLQLDEVSLPWRELHDIIFGLESDDTAPDAVLALDLLHAWNGIVAADSPGAAVFERFLREMARRIAASRAPNTVEWALGRGFSMLMGTSTFSAGRTSRVIRRIREQPDGWFPRGWPDEMRDALASVVRGLRDRFGPDSDRWGWGYVRPATLEHPLGRVTALAPIFNRGPFPWGGDSNTVSQAGGSNPMVIASLRVTVPVGDWESTRFVLPGGQSGNPFSPHYDDMLPLWKKGSGVPIAWSDEAVRRAAVTTLRLESLGKVSPS